MIARKRSKPRKPTAPGWTECREWSANGRKIEPGTVLSIRGERGRFTFVRHVSTDKAEWIDVIGGPKGTRQWRSFRPERVRTVHIGSRRERAVKRGEVKA